MSNLIDYKLWEMLWLKYLYDEIKNDNIIKWKNIAVYLHWTIESAIFMHYLIKLWANVFYSSCNPLSLQEDVTIYLKKIWVNCYSFFWENTDDISKNIEKIFLNKIDFIVDDWCALISYVINKNILNLPIACSEQTTWWVNKCINIINNYRSLKFPIIAVNNHKTKHEFDNSKWVSSSLISCIINKVHITFSWKNIMIFWYWSVWRWLSIDLKNLGAKVHVSEISNYNSLKAFYDWMIIGKKEDLISNCDIFITCTWSKQVLTKEDFNLMREGSILVNAWHSNVEIDVEYLYDNAINIIKINKDVEKIYINNNNFILVAKWRVANLVAWNWNPPEIMDLTFMNQLYAIYYWLKNVSNLDTKKINDLSNVFDEKISELKLKSYWITIDKEKSIQKKYKSQWITQI